MTQPDDPGHGREDLRHDPAAVQDPAHADPEAEPSTGDPRLDPVVARLRELDELAISEHPSVYEDVHRQLQEALAEPEAADVPPTGDHDHPDEDADHHVDGT